MRQGFGHDPADPRVGFGPAAQSGHGLLGNAAVAPGRQDGIADLDLAGSGRRPLEPGAARQPWPVRSREKNVPAPPAGLLRPPGHAVQEIAHGGLVVLLRRPQVRGRHAEQGEKGRSVGKLGLGQLWSAGHEDQPRSADFHALGEPRLRRSSPPCARVERTNRAWPDRGSKAEEPPREEERALLDRPVRLDSTVFALPVIPILRPGLA